MQEIIYGRNTVYETLQAGRRRCEKVLIAGGTHEGGATGRILAAAKERSIPVQRVARQQLDQLGAVNHQGVAAQVSPYPYVGMGDVLSLGQQRGEQPLLLLLDCLQDPQNLGTLLRTAEAVAVHGVILPRRRTVQVTPAVSNASAGAVEHLLIVQVTNLVRAMADLKQEGIWVVGLEQDPRARDYRQVDLNMPLALVVGSEGSGLRRLVRERCDLLIQLPMGGSINSLNASVAGSIALYQAWQQRLNHDSGG